MTSVLDLFSDAPPVSMPTTATIMTTASALLVLCLSGWDRFGPVIRMSLFALIMGLFATSAKAENYNALMQWQAAGGLYADPTTACGALVPAETGIYAGTPYVYGSLMAAKCYRPSGQNIGVTSLDASCPSGGTPSGATAFGATNWQHVCVDAAPCPEGQVRDPVTKICTAPPCQAGETATLNLGVGYARTTRNVDDWINPQFYSTACSSGCQVTVGAVVAGSCGVGGLIGPPYPGYCDFETTTTGQECTASDEAAVETLPPIPCPSGTQAGTVNGAGGCYAVSTATKETTVTDNGDGTTTTTETVTGPTGTTTTTTTCNGDGACSSTTTHVGGGGSTSSPGEIGQDYDGSLEGEEEGEGACGKEGLPDCKVKVNEDGTPETVEGAQEALTGVIDGVQERLEYLGGMGWVREDLPFVWGPSFPSGSCSAIEIYGQPINICDPLSKVRLVWAFIISFMAGLYIWRSGTQAIKG